MKPIASQLGASIFPFALGSLLILLCGGCLAHKSVDATYETYGLGLQAPPTPVSPPFGLAIGVTKATYHSDPKSNAETDARKRNELMAAIKVNNEKRQKAGLTPKEMNRLDDEHDLLLSQLDNLNLAELKIQINRLNEIVATNANRFQIR